LRSERLLHRHLPMRDTAPTLAACDVQALGVPESLKGAQRHHHSMRVGGA